MPHDDSLPDCDRRKVLWMLGAVPLTTTLVGCSVGGNTEDREDREKSAEAPAPAPPAPAAFVHPGLLHTQADFDRMATKVKDGVSPWIGGWQAFLGTRLNDLTAWPAALPEIYRGNDGVHGENYTALFKDVGRAYVAAMHWKVTGDTRYADQAVRFMNAWSSTLTLIAGGTEAGLVAGIQGYQFANVGEIMRTYDGLKPADLLAFQSMMKKVFYRINHGFLTNHNGTPISHYWANWDLCNIASMIAIGVLCDDKEIFDEGVNYFKSGPGNGAIAQAVYYMHPGKMGQWQETGRDQGHNTLGIALVGPICEMAWNQGIDLYGLDDNRVLAGAEYVAKANLIESGTSFYTVPYVPYHNRDVQQNVFATGTQGMWRPCWALIFNHYVNRKGLAAPYSEKFMLQMQPEGGVGNYGWTSGGFDQLGFGTLAFTRDPIPAGAPPSGLTATLVAGRVELSWWGSAYATGYAVKRSDSAAGPFLAVATLPTDPLTWTDSPPSAGTWYYVVSATTSSGTVLTSDSVAIATGTVPIAALSFDEGAGSTAADSTGLGNAATLAAGAQWGTGRNGGGALSLDGKGGHASLPADILVGASDFTISTWVYCNALSPWARVFDFGSGPGRYLMLAHRKGTGQLRFAITVDGSYGEQGFDSPAALPIGRWVHLAVTLSGRTATVYVDGLAVAVNTDMTMTPAQVGPMPNNWLGRSQYVSDPGFNGRVDDFRIWRSALDATAVAALAAA
jgi:hypothetical protein